MLTVRTHDSIHEIDPVHWDSILNADDTFHNWRFMRVVEDARIGDSRFRYLLFYSGERLVASTVLATLAISLDIFVADLALVRLVRRLWPGILKIRILICGLPASFGQSNLRIIDRVFADEVCSLVAAEMKMMAVQLKIRFLSVKEFSARDREIGIRLLQEGFFLANSIPYMGMQVQWDCFSAYLQSLRHSYRRHILQSLRKLQCAEPVVIRSDEYDMNAPGAAWVLSDPAWVGSQQYHHLYMRVMDRTKTKLETLNPAFFAGIFEDSKHFQLLSLVVDGNILSSALLVAHGDTLTFMLAGRANDADQYDSYFNLVYGIISHAIAMKYTRIRLGQTAYWVKQSVGGLPEDRYFYFRCTGRFRHWVLRTLNRLVFPPHKLKPVVVFNRRGFPAASRSAAIPRIRAHGSTGPGTPP